MLVSNATLTAISTVPTDGYDADAVPAARWSGTVDAYLEKSTRRITTASGSTFERAWTVYLDRAQKALVGDTDLLTVTQVLSDGSTATFHLPVLAVDDRYQPDMPADVQSLAIVVEPATAG